MRVETGKETETEIETRDTEVWEGPGTGFPVLLKEDV